jgi:hypothetical protein
MTHQAPTLNSAIDALPEGEPREIAGDIVKALLLKDIRESQDWIAGRINDLVTATLVDSLEDGTLEITREDSIRAKAALDFLATLNVRFPQLLRTSNRIRRKLMKVGGGLLWIAEEFDDDPAADDRYLREVFGEETAA